MPRKTKEQKELENEEKSIKKVSKTKASTTKKISTTNEAPTVTKNTKSKTSTTKSVTSKKASSSKASSSTNKKDTSKKSTTKSTAPKKATTKKATTKSTTAKKSTTKKATSKKEPVKKASTSKAKKSVSRKSTSSKTSTTKKGSSKLGTAKSSSVNTVEYYDLPYRYNQTIVKVLAQTPTNLFIYWDIADSDRKNFEEQYGENFFETTKPILIVYNDTLGYQFEVEINDFANSWYLHVADSKCDYRVELGRRPIIKTEKLENTDYIYIATSNEIESPNDRVLLDKEQKMVYFRNVKTGTQTSKPINTMSFIRNMGKIYNIYDLYKAIYNEENIEEFYDLSNPSSGNPSSGTYSSKFR